MRGPVLGYGARRWAVLTQRMVPLQVNYDGRTILHAACAEGTTPLCSYAPATPCLVLMNAMLLSTNAVSGTDVCYGATHILCAVWYWRMLCSYTSTTRCTVLTSGMLLPGNYRLAEMLLESGAESGIQDR
eukprot:3925745-Rhodomonas_salina.4